MGQIGTAKFTYTVIRDSPQGGACTVEYSTVRTKKIAGENSSTAHCSSVRTPAAVISSPINKDR